MLERGYLSGVVTAFRRRWSLQGRHDPSFLGTRCSGDAQGKLERRI
jgi:hypothetical protein